MKIIGSRTYENILYKRIFTIHKGMLGRCYNPNSTSYSTYGAKGVTVDERWHNLDNFIEDIDKIDGFDYNKFIKAEIQLDKDFKQIGVKNKVYSLNTCVFLGRSDNCGNRNNNQDMIIIDPDGNKYESRNREKFCREHNLDTRHAHAVLQGKNPHHKGWQFFYKETFNPANVLLKQIILGTNSDGDEFLFNNISTFAKEQNLSGPNISMVLSGKNKTHKGWTFKIIQKGFTIR